MPTPELAYDAQQAGCPQVDLRDASTTKFLPHELARFRPMVIQPSEMVQTLVDDFLIPASLVVHNHGPPAPSIPRVSMRQLWRCAVEYSESKNPTPISVCRCSSTKWGYALGSGSHSTQ